jgi:hypothetical protein
VSIPLTIENLANGGAVERLHAALQQALDNILDPNTPETKPRRVDLKITIKPKKQRQMADVEVVTSVKTQAPSPLETSILIDVDKKGAAVAAEIGADEFPGAVPLPGMEAKSHKITQLNVARAQ